MKENATAVLDAKIEASNNTQVEIVTLRESEKRLRRQLE